jgi:hypothetical protein
MSEQADKCRHMASLSERDADSATDPNARLMYLDLAQKWREMADHVKLQESLLRRRNLPQADIASFFGGSRF